jgi:hypothetical protein
MDRLLARIAFYLACAGPIFLIWTAIAHSPSSRHAKPQADSVAVMLALLSPAGVALGAGALLASRVRYGRRRTNPDATASIAVGILASLATAVFYPVVAQTHHHGGARSCLSNVKQLQLACIMYAQDYDDRLPIAPGWNDATMPYLKNAQVYRCPEEENETLPSYGLNRRMAQRHLPEIESQATTVLLIDSLPGKDRLVSRVSFPLCERHDQYLYIGFPDGHAKSMAKEKIPGLIWSPRLVKPQPGHP